jgi:hypothetical protein
MPRLPRIWTRLCCATTVGIALVAVAAIVVLRSTSVHADISRPALLSPGGALDSSAARTAIVDLLKRLREMGPEGAKMPEQYLALLDPDHFAKAHVQHNQDGTYAVGWILVDPKQRSYAFEIGGGCRFHYIGSFERTHGEWHATVPHWDWVACKR